MVLGLHLQHGGERGCRDCAERALELVQHPEISEATEDLGSMAWSHCGMDHPSHEFRTVRFCALGPNGRRPQLMAFGYSRTDNLVVQVCHESWVEAANANMM